MVSTPESKTAAVRGVVFDLDGTIYDERGLVSGADTAVARLRHAGIRVCFATNTTRRPRQALVERMCSLGIEVRADDVVTAPRAAVSLLQARRLRAVALHVARDTEVDFEGVVREDESPDAVVVGDLGDGWTFHRLNQAFRQLMTGAELVALQKNRYWQTSDGLTLDAGPFVAALEYAAATRAILVGKPSDAFFDASCRLLGLPRAEVLMVGDDVESDVIGAMRAGMRGVLVRTGKFRPDALSRGVEPASVIRSVADLPGWLGV